MTRRDSGPDFDPRHRIIGAIVVITLAVIFIPMVLSERPPPAPQAALDGYPAQEKVNRIVVTPVPPPETAARPAKNAAPSPASAAVPRSASEPRPASPPAKPAAPEAGWVVQVGTFSNTANATRLAQKLRAKGEPVRTERIRLAGGRATRLHVGPFRDRETALEAQARIHKEVGLKGVVLAYP